jgi:hypothetical protein
MMTVHGLVDSLYMKELAKKTHRGLEGLALKGFHTGAAALDTARKSWMVGANSRLTKRRLRSYVASSTCPLPAFH